MSTSRSPRALMYSINAVSEWRQRRVIQGARDVAVPVTAKFERLTGDAWQAGLVAGIEAAAASKMAGRTYVIADWRDSDPARRLRDNAEAYATQIMLGITSYLDDPAVHTYELPVLLQVAYIQGFCQGLVEPESGGPESGGPSAKLPS